MSPEPTMSPRDLRMRGLRASIEEIRHGVQVNAEEEILRATAEAGAHLYALWTEYKVGGGKQVAWSGDDPVRRTIVGLVYARGEADHQNRHTAMAVGYAEAPYGQSPYGGGWLWVDCPTEREHFKPSEALYNEHVRWRSIPDPLVIALDWFEGTEPE